MATHRARHPASVIAAGGRPTTERSAQTRRRFQNGPGATPAEPARQEDPGFPNAARRDSRAPRGCRAAPGNLRNSAAPGRGSAARGAARRREVTPRPARCEGRLPTTIRRRNAFPRARPAVRNLHTMPEPELAQNSTAPERSGTPAPAISRVEIRVHETCGFILADNSDITTGISPNGRPSELETRVRRDVECADWRLRFTTDSQPYTKAMAHGEAAETSGRRGGTEG
jgi:hypothetical protein